MKPILPTPKPTKEEKPKFISYAIEASSLWNQMKQSRALIVKKEVEISEEMKLEHVGEHQPIGIGYQPIQDDDYTGDSMT